MVRLFDILAAKQLEENYEEVLITTVCLTILGTIGLIGNGMVIYIYLLKFQKNSSNIFITYLAVIDFLICLIIIPYTLVKEWQTEFTSDIVCRLLEGIQGSMMPMSTLVLVAISVERFCLIYFMPSIVTSPKQAAIVIALIIFFAISLGVPTALSVSVNVLTTINGKKTYVYLGFCKTNAMILSTDAIHAYWVVVSSFFGLMMMTIIILYSAIFLSVYQRSYLFHKKMQQNSRSPAITRNTATTSQDQQVTEQTEADIKMKSTLEIPTSADRATSPPFMARKVAPQESPSDSLFKELTPNTPIGGSITQSELTIDCNRSPGDLIGDHCKSEESFTHNQNPHFFRGQSKETDEMKLSVSELSKISDTDVYAQEGQNTNGSSQIPEISICSQTRRATITMDTNEGDVMAITTIGNHTHQEIVIKQNELGVVVSEIDNVDGIKSSTEAVLSSPVHGHKAKGGESEATCSQQDLGKEKPEISTPCVQSKGQAVVSDGRNSADGTVSVKPSRPPSGSIPVHLSLISNSRPPSGSISLISNRPPSGTISVISNNVPMVETAPVTNNTHSQLQMSTTKLNSRPTSGITVASRPTSGIKAANSRPPTGQKSQRIRPTSAHKTKTPHLLTAKILLIVTLTFIVSYLPMILMMNGLIVSSRVIYMFFINNAANPIIYSSMNKKFQEKIMEEYHKVAKACKRRRVSQNARQ
jgi:hypothetical protein